jgi:hypothetical protein
MRIVSSVLAAAALASTAAAALAQGLSVQSAPASWKPLPQRQDEVAAQIASGVESGALSGPTAQGLRDQFKGLLDLEDQYRKTGLTPAQQADLQARYDTLARIQVDTHPASIETRRAPAAGPSAQ